MTKNHENHQKCHFWHFWAVGKSAKIDVFSRPGSQNEFPGTPREGGIQNGSLFGSLLTPFFDQKYPFFAQNGSFMDRFTREYILTCVTGVCPDGPQKSRFFKNVKNDTFQFLNGDKGRARTRARPSNTVSASVRVQKWVPFWVTFWTPKMTHFGPFYPVFTP